MVCATMKVKMMKTRKILMALSVAALSGLAVGVQERKSALGRHPVRVLYIGDSLSDFDRGSNHVDRLQTKLDSLSPRCVSIYNYAVRGDYIGRVLDRFHGVTNCLFKTAYDGIWGRQYDWAFVFLGHNDTRTWGETNFTEPEMSDEMARSYMSKLIELLKSKGIGRIILVSTSSPNFELSSRKAASLKAAIEAGKTKVKRVARYGEPRLLEAYNAILADLAKAPGVEYLDLYSLMKEVPEKEQLLSPSDGLHLTEKGHAYVADVEYRYLTSNLAR